MIWFWRVCEYWGKCWGFIVNQGYNNRHRENTLEVPLEDIKIRKMLSTILHIYIIISSSISRINIHLHHQPLRFGFHLAWWLFFIVRAISSFTVYDSILAM